MKVLPLVTVEWVVKALRSFRPTRPIQLVQAVMKRNDLPKLSAEEFTKQHIPGAVAFDLNECLNKTSDFPIKLPSEQMFSEYVQHLGITNNAHVITYENNADLAMIASPRLWWMFRAFSHNHVSVLNGGLVKWVASGQPVEQRVVKPVKAKQPFQAKLNQHLIKYYEDMVANVGAHGKHFPVVDCRGSAQYESINDKGQQNNIDYSTNLPFIGCLNKDLSMKDPEQLKEVFMRNGVDLNEHFTSTCHSGMTACIVALAAHHSGCKHVSVYDGSWAEYSQLSADV